MKWPTKIFFIFVIAIVASLVAMVSRQSLRSPREVLQEVQAELEGQGFDERALLRRLAGALRRAEGRDTSLPAQRELCADLRIARGRLLLSIGATEEARADFDLVLREYRPGEREVRRLLAETESSAGLLDDALLHLRELLADEPGFGPAWVEVGKLERQQAEATLAECDAKLRLVLIEEDAAIAGEILRGLAARDPLDAGRATSIVDLRALFPSSGDESLGQILGLADRASEHFARCREALVRSFSIAVDPQALQLYLEILEESGRAPEALALGSLIARQGPELAAPESAELLIRVLLARGDDANASQLASTWINGTLPLPAEFLRLACQALLRGKRWADLAKASFNLRSIGSSDDENLHELYVGLVWSLSSNKLPARALQALKTFARSTTRDPFPGARELAWREVAKLHFEAGDTTGEREALQAALAEEGDDPGSLWLRRAEIQMAEANNGYRLPLESWARAMSHLPARTEELFGTFVQLGEEALRAEERSVEVVFADLQRSGGSVPQRDYGPYVLYRIAELHGKVRHHVQRANAARTLLARLPNFVPAIDQLIAARDALGDREKYIEQVLLRLELTGLTDRSRELLATIRIQELSAPQLVQVMQIDPRGTGRMFAAAWLAENGRRDEALAALAAGGSEGRSDAESLFGAQVLMSEGRYRGALEWLDGVPAESPLHGAVLRSAARAALRLGEGPEITTRVAALLAGKPLEPGEMMEWIDGFIENGKAGTAALMIERVPRGQLPDPSTLLLREIQVALLQEDLPRIELLVERAAAFLPEGSYVALRVVLAAERGDWTGVRQNAQELRETDFAQDPIVSALLELLAGQAPAAGESAAFALSLVPDMPVWLVVEAAARLSDGQPPALPDTLGPTAARETELFLLGAGADPDDPRRAAALLLLARDPRFTPYVIGRLSGMTARERGILWPRLLTAELLLAGDRQREAAELYRRLLGTHDQCQPAWDALETLEIARYGSGLHPELQRLRDQRLRALAEADPQGPAGMLIASRTLVGQGDLGSALRLVINAQKIAPEWYEARHAVAEMYTQQGHWQPALESWRSLVAEASEVDAQRAVQGFLEALRLASRAQPPAIDLATIGGELIALAGAHPRDPLVVLALARLDLRQEQRNSALALERAWSRLRRLREQTGSRSLEQLGRGATAAWAEFYVETDPDSAEAFLLSELALQPGNLQLWRLLGRVHRDLGRFDESYEVLARVSMMSPSLEVKMEIARTFVAQGASPRTVTRALQQADQLRRGPRPLESQLLAAEAFLSDFRQPSWEAACTQLERLWDLRHQLEVDADRTRLAQLFGRALLLRGGEGDTNRALEVLAAEYDRTEPPYQREHFAALAGIARAQLAVSE